MTSIDEIVERSRAKNFPDCNELCVGLAVAVAKAVVEEINQAIETFGKERGMTFRRELREYIRALGAP